MKNLILIPTIVLALTASLLANNEINYPVAMLTTSTTTVSVEKSEKKIFMSVEMTKDQNSLKFKTYKNIAFVQVYSEDGRIEFQLPVEATNVRLKKNLFETGKYKLGFKIKGETELHFAEVELK
jgi:hypothetical protein